jgi:hypothetical protein
MFTDVVSKCDFLEVIKEESDEDASTVKLMLRVKDKTRWASLMLKLLKDNFTVEDFSIAINKSYWINETGEMVFCWVLLLWGDLDLAATTLAPDFAKKSPSKSPPLHAVSTKAKNGVVVQKPSPDDEEDTSPIRAVAPGAVAQPGTIVENKQYGMEEGIRRTATVVRLPHRHGPRNPKPQNAATKKLNSPKGRYAFAESISGDEGNPWGA